MKDIQRPSMGSNTLLRAFLLPLLLLTASLWNPQEAQAHRSEKTVGPVITFDLQNLDASQLVDLTGQFSIGFGRFVANRSTGQTTVDATLTNNGDPVAMPAVMLIGANNPDITFDGADGLFDGKAVLDMDRGAGVFGTGETRQVPLVMNNVGRSRLSISIEIHQVQDIEIASFVEPEANAAGWHNTGVDVSFACASTIPLDPINPCIVVGTTENHIHVATEGTNQEVQGQATDTAVPPNTANTSVFLNIDLTPPTITPTIDPPANAAGWHNTDPTVSFGATDLLSGVDGASITPPVTVTDESAETDVLGEAQDIAGNAQSANVIVRLDKTAPLVDILLPLAGTTFSLPNVQVSGTASDGLSGLSAVTCDNLSDGNPPVNAAFANGLFDCGVVLQEGANQIQVRATDAAGNQATDEVNLNLVTPLNVAITSPADMGTTQSSSTAVQGTISDGAATVKVNGIAAQVAGLNFTASNISLAPGKNFINAVATKDLGGGLKATGIASIQFFKDMTPPVLTITSPLPGAQTGAATVDVCGSVNDVGAGTVSGDDVQIFVNGIPATVVNRHFQVLDVPLVLGSNILTATGTDKAGNAAAPVSVEMVRLDLTGQATIIPVSGDNQIGPILSQLPQPLVVELRDNTNTPVPGAAAVFKIMQNNGQLALDPVDAGNPANILSPDGRTLIVHTDANGQARARWTLGNTTGPNNVVDVSAAGFAGMPVFTATSTAADPARLVLNSGNNQRGAVNDPLPLPFDVIVTDAGHNRLPGINVRFNVQAGDGHINGASTANKVSDGDGRAAILLTMGPAPGVENNEVFVDLPDFPGVPGVTFVASGVQTGPDPNETAISGVVLDNEDQPIANVNVFVHPIGQAPGPNPPSAVTGADGTFQIKPIPPGDQFLVVDGTTAGNYPSLEFEVHAVSGVDNLQGRPFFLVLLADPSTCVSGQTGGVITVASIPGLSLNILPGSATDTALNPIDFACVTMTSVNTSKVPMPPNFGQEPSVIVAIMPHTAVFDPPAPLTLPNVDALPPGEITEMYSFDHDIGQFVSIGTGTVSADGLTIVSDPGFGIVKGGWHCGGNPIVTGSGQNVQVTTSKTVLNIGVGKTGSVTATGSPLPSGNPAYTWLSLNNAVAEINPNPTTSNAHPNTISIKGAAVGTTNVRVTYKCKSDATATKLVKVNVIKVDLAVEKDKLTLGKDNKLTATVMPAGIAVQNYKFEIRFASEATWFTLQSSASNMFSGKARVAGKFKVRVTATIDGQQIMSEEKDIEVQFPSCAEIAADADVTTFVDKSWTDTKNAAVNNSRREEGYWIQYDANTCKYKKTATVVGAAVNNATTASTGVGPRPADTPANITPLSKPTYTVADFHTHTPMTFRTGLRGIGPSAQDIATNGVYPGLVYDYVGTHKADGTADASGTFIKGGHAKNDAAQVYHSGITRRATP